MTAAPTAITTIGGNDDAVSDFLVRIHSRSPDRRNPDRLNNHPPGGVAMTLSELQAISEAIANDAERKVRTRCTECGTPILTLDQTHASCSAVPGWSHQVYQTHILDLRAQVSR